LSSKTEIQSIEDVYKDELSRKLNEYHLNSENITFQHDSISLSIDQKYLVMKHDVDIQYLNGKLSDETYYSKLDELKKCESEETSINIKSWIANREKNVWPTAPIPVLLFEKRNSSETNSNFLFFVSGILLFFFLLVDILAYQKVRKQPEILKKEIQSCIHDNTMMLDGQKLTRLTVTLEDGDVIDSWIGGDGMDVEVPPETTAAWDKAKQQSNARL
jgi:hypothetical protein